VLVLLKESKIVVLVKCFFAMFKKLIKYLPLGNTPLNERFVSCDWKSKEIVVLEVEFFLLK